MSQCNKVERKAQTGCLAQETTIVYQHLFFLFSVLWRTMNSIKSLKPSVLLALSKTMICDDEITAWRPIERETCFSWRDNLQSLVLLAIKKGSVSLWLSISHAVICCSLMFVKEKKKIKGFICSGLPFSCWLFLCDRTWLRHSPLPCSTQTQTSHNPINTVLHLTHCCMLCGVDPTHRSHLFRNQTTLFMLMFHSIDPKQPESNLFGNWTTLVVLLFNV